MQKSNPDLKFIIKLTEYYTISQSAGKKTTKRKKSRKNNFTSEEYNSELNEYYTDMNQITRVPNQATMDIMKTVTSKIFDDNDEEYYPNLSPNVLRDLDNNIYQKTIDNPNITPWLDWIIEGKKTYEARLNEEEWRELQVGDVIIFSADDGKEVKVMVQDLKYYKDFGEAFQNLGKKLVPIKGITIDEVKDIYWDYYSEDDIEKNGIVAFGIKILD